MGRVEARAKQGLRPADALKGSHDVQRERDQPIVIDVGQLALGLRPDELIGIELRRPRRDLRRGMARRGTDHGSARESRARPSSRSTAVHDRPAGASVFQRVPGWSDEGRSRTVPARGRRAAATLAIHDETVCVHHGRGGDSGGESGGGPRSGRGRPRRARLQPLRGRASRGYGSVPGDEGRKGPGGAAPARVLSGDQVRDRASLGGTT